MLQFLHGEDAQSVNAEEESLYSGNPAEEQAQSQLPRPTRVPPARPPRPDSAEGIGSYGGSSSTHLGTQPVNSGRIVFPSD